jgi:hypothetical protein
MCLVAEWFTPSRPLIGCENAEQPPRKAPKPPKLGGVVWENLKIHHYRTAFFA